MIKTNGEGVLLLGVGVGVAEGEVGGPSLGEAVAEGQPELAVHRLAFRPVPHPGPLGPVRRLAHHRRHALAVQLAL